MIELDEKKLFIEIFENEMINFFNVGRNVKVNMLIYFICVFYDSK